MFFEDCPISKSGPDSGLEGHRPASARKLLFLHCIPLFGCGLWMPNGLGEECCVSDVLECPACIPSPHPTETFVPQVPPFPLIQNTGQVEAGGKKGEDGEVGRVLTKSYSSPQPST